MWCYTFEGPSDPGQEGGNVATVGSRDVSGYSQRTVRRGVRTGLDEKIPNLFQETRPGRPGGHSTSFFEGYGRFIAAVQH